MFFILLFHRTKELLQICNVRLLKLHYLARWSYSLYINSFMLLKFIKFTCLQGSIHGIIELPNTYSVWPSSELVLSQLFTLNHTCYCAMLHMNDFHTGFQWGVVPCTQYHNAKMSQRGLFKGYMQIIKLLNVEY